MIPFSIDEAVRVTGAAVAGPVDRTALVRTITADSREVRPGAVFVALPGEHLDGQAFVQAAAGAGAVAALTRSAVAGAPCLVVADPLAAFGQLARHVVDLGVSGDLRVVGITGSSGKTSTKDLLAHVLESHQPTVAPAGNLNNELGVPLTVVRVTEATRFLIAEMGARGIGHIAYLCRIAPPQVGVVLNVGHAHVGEFGGQQAIAIAKGELVEALPSDGWAVLNAADPLVWAMRDRTSARVVAFSAVGDPGQAAAVWATDAVGDQAGCYRFALHARWPGAPESSVEVQLGLVGRHQVANALAVAAAAGALGLGPVDIGAALESARPRSRWRMEVSRRADGTTIVNDAYNANPDSMRAAVDTLAELGAGGRRTWALLGDMLELGDDAIPAHRELGEYVAERGVDELIALGGYAEAVVQGAESVGGRTRARVAVDKHGATEMVTSGLGPGDVVLVKASRGLALNTVADALIAAEAAPTMRPDTAVTAEVGEPTR